MKRAMVLIALVCFASFASAATTMPSHHHGDDEKTVGGVCSLDVCADGERLHLLTAVRGDGQPRLQYQSSDDGGATWSVPVEFGAAQPPTIAKRGMDAQIAASGKHLVAVWPTAGTDKMGRGPMATAISDDAGRTWRAGPNPADDNLTIGHSFIDLAADPRTRGRFHLVWLDGREGATKGLRYARSDDAGATWSANQTLDPDTCECCWNTIATTPQGRIAVLYRDANPRDMALVQSLGGTGWTSPVPVGRFEWDITACPHVGGALAFSSSNAAHALVWLAKDNDIHGVYALHSSDGGATFDTPQRLGPHTASRPDLCATADGHLVATWDADAPDDTSPKLIRGIYTASSADAGRSWSTPRRLSDPARIATHPRVAHTTTATRIFWTESPPAGPVTWASKLVGDL